MNMLKRELAPLSKDAWAEIDSRAAEVIRSRLSARKALKVNGPKGWDYTVLTEGRLDLIGGQDGDVKTASYKVQPLIEGRISFTLNRWEMDNILRGAKDIDLSNLEDAAAKIAKFEEKAIYKGYLDGRITGLEEGSAHSPIPFGMDGTEIMESIAKSLIILNDNYQEGPFILVVGKEAWKRINKVVHGYPLLQRIESLIGGKIIYSSVVDGAILLPFDNENLELTIGQDFSIGYEYHDAKDVTLFITESFTFRILDSNIFIPFTI